MGRYADDALQRRQLRQQGVEDLSGPTPGSAYSSMSREQYESKIKSRNADTRAPAAEGAQKDAIGDAGRAMGSQVATQGAQSGDLTSTVGGGLMMTGNPFAMAAGLGLQVYAAGEANKRAKQEQQRQEYNDRVARRQDMMNKIAQMRIE